ncbi:MAG: primosomal protein N', partial [Rhodobiaceae bacterium]|nr:primosomal protein N' [Rhodobiaceae bacterium]
TGSGKTEVYFEAVAAALRAGRQVLVLLPEIALTAQFIDRFEARFGDRPAEWHSEIPANRRGRVWRGVLSGEVRIVVGARSALFLPFTDLGLVVIDEEHEAAYKQEDRVWYNARDMAVVRARFADAEVVLASATPSIETRHNADEGRYHRLHLPDRFGGRDLPEVGVVDMRTEAPERGRWLSPPVVQSLIECLEAGRQGLLFLNRRGYAPLTLCRKCGHRFECPDCTSWLTEHRFRHELMCHHCGYRIPTPENCPKCGESDALVACGPGVERVAEEVAERFPDARKMIMSSDVMGGPAALRDRFAMIETGEVDIVVGTQLIAKGHNFPGLSFVGVVDADMGLGMGDLRATERTFQLLSQVVGRAGRGNDPGHALIQTYMPEHPVLKTLVSGDSEAFYAREIEARRSAHLPPFSRLAAIIVSGKDRIETRDFAAHLSRIAPRQMAGIEILGPAEAPLAMVRGRYRIRFLVKADRQIRVQPVIAAWLSKAGRPRGSLRIAVDIDPYSFL